MGESHKFTLNPNLSLFPVQFHSFLEYKFLEGTAVFPAARIVNSLLMFNYWGEKDE